MFILGIVSGFLIATFILLVLLFFRKSIETRLPLIQNYVEERGPRPKGYIFEPPEEAEEMRQDIIERNNKNGKDTRLSDLF